MRKLVLVATMALSSLPLAANAASLDAAELLQQFSVITTGDVTVESLHVHGRMLVGGELTGNLAEVNHDNIDNIVASDFDELIIGNATANSQARVFNGGTASYDGAPAYLDLQGGSASPSSPAVMPENYAAVLDAFSLDLAGMAVNATADTTTMGNRITFGGLSGEVTVFDIVTADLLNRDVAFDLNGAELIVINVTGSGDYAWLSNMTTAPDGKDVSSNVIWNFLGFDSLDLERSLWGSVLASGTDVTLGADLEGALYAGSLTGRAQVHVQPLDYDIPPVSQVPLPAGLPLLGAALAGMALLRRRAAA